VNFPTALVLKHVRDNPKVTCGALASKFGVDFEPGSGSEKVGTIYMIDVLEALESAGLVSREGQGEEATCKVSSSWARVQKTLSISLTELAARQAGQAMLVHPTFGLPRRLRKVSSIAFAIMPFASEMDSVYAVIQEAALASGLEPSRADKVYSGTDVILMHETWSALCAADVVIADCTGRNANVMYELGIAHTLGKPVLMISQSVADTPFDINHRRMIAYEASRLGLQRLGIELRKHLAAHDDHEG
jgi:hypothetical protein